MPNVGAASWIGQNDPVGTGDVQPGWMNVQALDMRRPMLRQLSVEHGRDSEPAV
jgi:hypothetical protein